MSEHPVIPKLPFYKTNWFLWLMLILVPPVGIVLLWVNKKFQQPLRITLTVIFILWTIIIFPKGGDTSTTASVSASPATVIEATTAAETTASLVPTSTPTPVPTVTPTPEPTPTPFDPSSIKEIKKSGKGDDVVEIGVKTPWIYRCVAKYTGDSNFVVKVAGDLKINEIGTYNGAFMLAYGGTDAEEVEITADGSWSLTLEPLLYTDTSEASGKRSAVTDLFTAEGPGVYEITHEGDSNFVVYLHSESGDDLLINEIGDYSGKKKVNLLEGDLACWEVVADGKWSIKKAD